MGHRELEPIATMLFQAMGYDLATEVVWSFTKIVAPDLTQQELEDACHRALYEWDLESDTANVPSDAEQKFVQIIK